MSEEAEWCFGFPWLSIIYNQITPPSLRVAPSYIKRGLEETKTDMEKAQEYLEKSFKTIFNDQIPELYYSDSNESNENVPLAWAESLFVVALLKAGK